MTVQKVWGFFVLALALFSYAVGFGFGKLPLVGGWSNVVSIIVFLFGMGLTIRLGWTQVPEKEEWVIEFFGKYLCTWNAGLNIRFPYLGFMTVQAEVLMSQQIMRLNMDDNDRASYGAGHIDFEDGSAPVEATAYFTIVNSYNATYNISDVIEAVEEKLDSAIRVCLGKFTIDEANIKKAQFNTDSILGDEADKGKDWGVVINSIIITDIVLNEDQMAVRSRLQEASKEVEVAEQKAKQAKHDKDATITKAEAESSAIRIKAEGERAALVATAEGFASQVKALKDLDVDTSEATRYLAERVKWEKVGNKTVIIDSSGGGMAGLGAQFAAGSRSIDSIGQEK